MASAACSLYYDSTMFVWRRINDWRSCLLLKQLNYSGKKTPKQNKNVVTMATMLSA